MTIELHAPVEVLSAVEIEARAAADQIRAGLDDLWEGLARFVTVEGWTVLGYTSFRRWAVDELGYSLNRADVHLRKTKRLMELSQVMNRTIAELAPTMAIRNMHRKAPKSPIARSMLHSCNKLSAIPALTDPNERKAAIVLRGHLDRLLGSEP